jgi:Cu+-exporting ATPase
MAKHDRVTLKVEGMHCASCVANIERSLSKLDGVEECRVNLATNSAVVEYNGTVLDEKGIIGRIKEIGYGATLGQQDILTANERQLTTAKNRLIAAVLLSIPLMVIAMWPMFRTGPLISRFFDAWAEAILSAAIVVYAGSGILHDAFRQAKHLRANMNTLIAMGALASFGWSLYLTVMASLGRPHFGHALYFESAGMIITLILLGRYLEARSKGKAGAAIASLMKLRPKEATAIINGVEIEIDPATARPGMTLLVRPGQRVPADGEIIDGIGSLDESLVTGESMPQERKVGDTVIGGSLNGNAPFKMKVTATGEQSFLSGVIRMVAEAQGKKAPVQRLADRVAGVFVPVVILLALLTYVVWHFVAPSNPLIFPSVIAVLIIACPCALGLATPTAVLAGTGRAARAGIIIRGGDTLESLSKVDALVLDKTGTLTHGELAVTGVRSYDGIEDDDLLGLVLAVESQSEHPIAKAITRYAREHAATAASVVKVDARPGFGIVAESEGRRLVIGSRSLMESEGVEANGSYAFADRQMEEGKSVVYVALEGRTVGVISVADRVRGEAREVVEKIRRDVPFVSMVTGDNRRTAAEVAKTIGLDEFEPEVKPDGKRLMVESLRSAGKRVAMVGDGINDAPALAAADIGVAIGSGTDIAMEAADVILVRPDLTGLRRMLCVSRETMKVIRQNLFWAFFYNVIAIPVAAGVFYPVWGLTLSPMIAALAMAMSSVFVVTNSLRLSRLEMP